MLLRADEKVKAGDHAAAAHLYRQCAVLQPDNAVAVYNLGCCLHATGRSQEALAAFRASIALQPQAHAHIGLAEALRVQGDLVGAERHCDAALAFAPANAEAHVVLGRALWSAGRRADALKALRTAIMEAPSRPDAHLHLGVILTTLEDHEEATAHLRTARELNPGHVPTLIALCDAHRSAGRTWEAFEAIREASALEPRNAVVYANMAAVLSVTTMLDMAAAAARLALALSPDLWAAAYNLGMILMTQGRDEEAVAAYARAVAIDPSNGMSLFQLVKLHERSCDWEGLEAAREIARAVTYRSGRHAPPFSVLSLTGSPHEHLLSARAYAKTFVAHGRPPLAPYAAGDRSGRRLRIGYLSADFRTHAVADLVVELFELHDKAAIETFGYSLGPNDRSPMRARLGAALEHFHDLRDRGDREAADTIFRDGIDILVDLTGYTNGLRTRILALRPAPIQVNFLGYPGTLGAPFIDYIVADRHVAPFEHEPYYDEKIVHLPHCYQPNDRRRPMVRRGEPRCSHGLPETGFVFCCFNGTYKISAEVFDVWMRLLAAVPGSVLWLLKNDDRIEANLRREAERRGVAAHRLVFAPRVPSAQHLARISLADLFLDTLLYNAHTTASEALWVGVPIVTLMGEAFPARVGASLLRAVGLPDLVAETLADYEAKALHLASDPLALTGLTERLLRARTDAPLFDTPLFARHLEAAYRGMALRLDEGLPPAAFAVDPDTTS